MSLNFESTEIYFYLLFDETTYVLSGDTLADYAGVLVDEDLGLLSSLINASLGEGHQGVVSLSHMCFRVVEYLSKHL